MSGNLHFLPGGQILENFHFQAACFLFDPGDLLRHIDLFFFGKEANLLNPFFQFFQRSFEFQIEFTPVFHWLITLFRLWW